MATVGNQAGFVEEAPSQTRAGAEAGRVWRSTRGKGRVLGRVLFLVPGCGLHSLFVIF